MSIQVLVLNYNGAWLLPECLPSVVEAARRSAYGCDVMVIDNASTDDSLSILASRFPSVKVVRRANRGLCSFNDVVPTLPGRVAVLLNNDVKLDPDSIDPLVAPLLRADRVDGSACFMTAPLCWRFDGRTYEGFKTAVSWRWGLVQATALFAGHEASIRRADWTASAGAALAVDCRKFDELGGFDALFLPGRLEDLDFAFRGYQAGYHACYVPESVAYHLGMGAFGPAFGQEGCDRLALRNTLLFMWKNLRHPWHRVRHWAGLAARAARDLWLAPRVAAPARWATLRAIREAWSRWRQMRPARRVDPQDVQREWQFFRRFHPRGLT